MTLRSYAENTSSPSLSHMTGASLWALWGIVVKEMLVWVRSPLQVVISLASPLVLLLVATLLFSPSDANRIEIGVITPANAGPYTQKLVQHLTAETGVPMYFEIVTTDPEEAQMLFEQQRIFAIVTIPPDFDLALDQGQPATLDFQVYNAMGDVNKNVQMSFNRSLLAFYNEALPGQVLLQPQVNRLLPHDIPRSGYLSAGILVYTLMFVGILSTGVIMTREWEYHTLPELTVSPTPRFILVLSKTLAGLLQAGTITAVVFVIAYLLSDLRPTGNLFLIVAVLFLVGLMFVSFGALVGVAAKRIYLVMPASGIMAIVLWFLSGGFQEPLAVKGTAIFTISRVLPPTYAFEALHKLIHGPSLAGLGFDLFILAGTAFVFLVTATLVLQYQIGAE
jgi:ABC-2 type transport system permease protein